MVEAVAMTMMCRNRRFRATLLGLLASGLSLGALASSGCKSETRSESGERALPAEGQPGQAQSATDAPTTAAAIAHGGAGSPPEWSDGCRAAVDAALAALAAGSAPLDAAVAGVKVMEDDPRFNAGTGSRVRIDGKTVQMDAAVMDSEQRFGAVAVIENVRHPVEVARAVIDTPHLLLAGDGATALARARGIPEYDPTTDKMREKTREIMDKLRRADPSLPRSWQDFDWRASWNFQQTLKEAGLEPVGGDVGSDTVAVAVRGSDGRFAVAISTGGTAITLRGRVGDVPILGAGLYAGERGAVAATGSGELIVRKNSSREVYRLMESGTDPAEATQAGVQEIGKGRYIGLIAITADAMAAAADRDMAWAGREAGSKTWLGPTAGASSKPANKPANPEPPAPK